MPYATMAIVAFQSRVGIKGDFYTSTRGRAPRLFGWGGTAGFQSRVGIKGDFYIAAVAAAVILTLLFQSRVGIKGDFYRTGDAD